MKRVGANGVSDYEKPREGTITLLRRKRSMAPRILAIALASFAKMSISGMPLYCIYAIASVSIAMTLVSAGGVW